MVMTSMYPDYTYRDRLLFPQYLSNNNNIDEQVDGDPLLNLYIHQLDGNVADALSDEFDRNLTWNLADELRKHGWAVIVKYEDQPPIVLSEGARAAWIVEGDIVKGVDVAWADSLVGISYTDRLMFDDENVMLCRWYYDAYNFYKSDITDAIFNVAVTARQIRGQLDYVGAKPGFYWFKFSEMAQEDKINEVSKDIPYVNYTTGIGVSGSILEDIKLIPGGDVNLLMQLYDAKLEQFASITRLPLSFYKGQRMDGGLGKAAEETDVDKIERKIEEISNHISPYLSDYYEEVGFND